MSYVEVTLHYVENTTRNNSERFYTVQVEPENAETIFDQYEDGDGDETGSSSQEVLLVEFLGETLYSANKWTMEWSRIMMNTPDELRSHEVELMRRREEDERKQAISRIKQMHAAATQGVKA